MAITSLYTFFFLRNSVADFLLLESLLFVKKTLNSMVEYKHTVISSPLCFIRACHEGGHALMYLVVNNKQI